MTVLDRFRHLSVELSEEEAEQLLNPWYKGYTVRVFPPTETDLAATLDGLVKGVMEPQTQWMGLKNTSPTIAFEIRRHQPGELLFQYAVPTKRLDRKIRTHLPNTLDGVTLREGVTGLPVHNGASVGGGLLTTGRRDWFPIQNEFKRPPTNSIAAALHRHALPRSRFVIQVLFKPVAGQPVRRWYRNKRTYQQIGYLRKEKEQLWGSRSPTPREKSQANQIEDKAGTFQFMTSIRFIFTEAGDYTRSRVKELAGAFNTFEDSSTGQYLDAVTVNPFTRSSYLDFLQAVAKREFSGWSRSFKLSIPELAALISIPDRRQKNIANNPYQ
jgi:hypothetical protein